VDRSGARALSVNDGESRSSNNSSGRSTCQRQSAREAAFGIDDVIGYEVSSSDMLGEHDVPKRG
jgi:hypothetical protein